MSFLELVLHFHGDCSNFSVCVGNVFLSENVVIEPLCLYKHHIQVVKGVLGEFGLIYLNLVDPALLRFSFFSGLGS